MSWCGCRPGGGDRRVWCARKQPSALCVAILADAGVAGLSRGCGCPAATPGSTTPVLTPTAVWCPWRTWDDPYAIVTRLMEAVPSGSWLALSHPAVRPGDLEMEAHCVPRGEGVGTRSAGKQAGSGRSRVPGARAVQFRGEPVAADASREHLGARTGCALRGGHPRLGPPPGGDQATAPDELEPDGPWPGIWPRPRVPGAHGQHPAPRPWRPQGHGY